MIEIEAFRKLLGEDFLQAPDEEIEAIRSMLYRMADIVVADIVREHRQKAKAPSNRTP